MFVLMLAHQASDADNVGEIPAYDRRSRDPVAGVVVAALLAATITTVTLLGVPELQPAATEHEQLQASAKLLEQLPKRLDRALAESDFIAGGEVSLAVHDDTVVAHSGGHEAVIAEEDLPGSTSHVGWDLVARFPASLEVAGVVLLMAMFGAVVLARRQIELGEDELRASAGLAPLAPDEIEDPDA
jgi:NADH:ubiquinone oxidoreductase subunit 6 (subunit J)